MQVLQDEFEKCKNYEGKVYRNVLKPFFKDLYNLKFGVGWETSIPYDGYPKSGTPTRDEKWVNNHIVNKKFIIYDLKKIDPNGLMNYLIHLNQYNKAEFEKFKYGDLWNEIADKNVYLNYLGNAVAYRNYFEHTNDEKDERINGEINAEDIFACVEQILRPFKNNENLKHKSEKSYYEYFTENFSNFGVTFTESLAEICGKFRNNGIIFDEKYAEKICISSGFEVENGKNVIVNDLQKFDEFLAYIKKTHISFEKIREDLGLTEKKFDDRRIKSLCVTNEHCSGIYEDSLAVFKDVGGYQKFLIEVNGDLNAKKKKRKFLGAFAGILAVLVCVLAVLMLNDKNVYKNDVLKTYKLGQSLTFNVTKAVYEDNELYVDVIIDNWTGEAVIVKNPQIAIRAKNSSGDVVFEYEAVAYETWEVSPSGNILRKKIPVENRSSRNDFNENGISDLLFEIDVNYEMGD